MRSQKNTRSKHLRPKLLQCFNSRPRRPESYLIPTVDCIEKARQRRARDCMVLNAIWIVNAFPILVIMKTTTHHTPHTTHSTTPSPSPGGGRGGVISRARPPKGGGAGGYCTGPFAKESLVFRQNGKHFGPLHTHKRPPETKKHYKHNVFLYFPEYRAGLGPQPL